MPRSSQAKAQQNHQRIEETASQLFRERGIAGVSIEQLMQAAGMTKGGFYKHFSSKDALMTAACSHAFQETERARGNWRSPETGERTAQVFIEKYLSRLHRDNPGYGCPAAALPFELAHQPKDTAVRESFCVGIEGLIDEMAHLMPCAASSKRDAAAVLSMLVGAIAISRATNGTELSDQVLDAAKEFLLEFLAHSGS